MFGMAMWMAAIVAPAQIVMGDLHGLNTLQAPAGQGGGDGGLVGNRAGGAPLALFGIPNMRTETTDYEISIPYLSSLILTHSLGWGGAGAEAVSRGRTVPIRLIVFWSFRLMVGLGLADGQPSASASLWLRYRKRLFDDAHGCNGWWWRWGRPASSPCCPAG